MVLSSAMLSRIQFAFTVGFHILFPTLNIGLALFLVYLEGLWLKTRNVLYLSTVQFWGKIFALTFGMGVVSGVMLSYELGTNFGPLIAKGGSVLGPLLVYEVLAAFFLEAGFLGIMLFGWDKVGPRLHYLATVLVMMGTLLSATSIMSANSWMQTPAGAHLEGGQYVVHDWFKAFFNPSFVPRFLHMVIASYLTTCFVIAGISAWYLLKNRHLASSRLCFSLVLGAACLLAPLQVFQGDRVGLNIHQHQPLKTAAIEAIWDTQKGAPYIVAALIDSKQEKNHYAFHIPKMASLLNTHQWEGEMLGLKSVPPSERPVVGITFWSFRVMFGIGVLFVLIAVYSLWLRLRGQLFKKPWFYRLCVLSAPLGFVATVAGWLVAESGRQPWTVYQLIRTREAVSVLPPHQVMISLSLIGIVYTVVFSFYLYYLGKVIRTGPKEDSKSAEVDVKEVASFKYLAPERE